MIKPRYQDTPPKNIPVVYTDDKKVRVKVIAGTSLGEMYKNLFFPADTRL